MDINNDTQIMFRRELMYKRILNWLEHNKPVGFVIQETFSNHIASPNAEYHFTVSGEWFTSHANDCKNSFRLIFKGNMNFVSDFTLQFSFEKILSSNRVLSLHSYKKNFSDVSDSDVIKFSNDVEMLVVVTKNFGEIKK